MAEKKIKIKSAKGRPMLNWVGKKPLDYVKGFPAQLIEVYAPLGDGERIENPRWDALEDNWQNLLFQGDNKEVLATLLENGFREKIDFVYIDPPFDSGADYVRKVTLRGARLREKISGEGYSLGEQIQYFDVWSNDTYLQFMFERLQLLNELMNRDGFIAVHMNSARSHYVKLIMDEIFGSENFRNEIIVKRIRKSYTEKKGIKSLNEGCDYVLVYSKSPDSKLNPPLKYSPKEERWHSFDAPNIRKNLTYELFGEMPPAGRCWMMEKPKAEGMIKKGDLRPNPNTGWPEYRLEATNFIVRDTIWEDISSNAFQSDFPKEKKEQLIELLKEMSCDDDSEYRDSLWEEITAYAFKTDYPTEKKVELLQLLIEMCSPENGIVLDCFCGSGTTQVAAQGMGRRWIGCDVNKGAIHTTLKRMQEIIKEQSVEIKEDRKQSTLIDVEQSRRYPSLLHYRVNDYDLQLLRTEAIELAAEHIGVKRMRTDSFFDGNLGKNLVKIIDFNHPLTLLDLQLIQDELKKRPDENRNITIVCLGKETAADPWIEEYNKKHPVNKFEIIELRADTKYGKFLIHKPAEANVEITREGDKAIVEITDYISPTIVERLNSDLTMIKAKIPDFRSMIDVVLIDNNYNGEVFNITISDVPEKKNDLVEGRYKIATPKGKITVAVKIIDMLGEEVIISKEV